MDTQETGSGIEKKLSDEILNRQERYANALYNALKHDLHMWDWPQATWKFWEWPRQSRIIKHRFIDEIVADAGSVLEAAENRQVSPSPHTVFTALESRYFVNDNNAVYQDSLYKAGYEKSISRADMAKLRTARRKWIVVRSGFFKEVFSYGENSSFEDAVTKSFDSDAYKATLNSLVETQRDLCNHFSQLIPKKARYYHAYQQECGRALYAAMYVEFLTKPSAAENAFIPENRI